MRLIQGQRPSDTAYPYHLVQDEDLEAPMDAPPAFMMQPALPGPAPSVPDWPVAAPNWDATAYAPAASSDAPMFWGNTTTGGARQQCAAEYSTQDMDASSSATSSDDGHEPGRSS